MTRLALETAVAARRTLAEQLRREPHDREDFPETLARVRDSKLFTVPEIAELVGLSRSRTYELIAQADRERG